MKNINFDGRHAIPFSLLTDDEKRNLLRTVRTIRELPNGWFIAEFSGKCVRLTKANVDRSKAVQDRTVNLLLLSDRTKTMYIFRNVGAKRMRLSKNAPGAIALKLVDFVCNAKTVEKIFKPLVVDWRYEYFEALKANHRIKARWISVRYIWYFVLALGLTRVLSLVRPVLPKAFRSPQATAEQDLDNR